MVLPPRRVLRRARGLILPLAVGLTLVSIGVPAQADAPSISALLLRDDTRTLFREPGGTTTLNETKGIYQQDGTDYPTLEFTSQVGPDSSTFESLAVSAGLAPGTYTTSRIPGVAQAILDPGSFSQCGGTEPGTLTITQADYDGDGNLLDLAASFDIASCDSQPVAHGELRWNSATPLALAQAPVLTEAASSVIVNSTADVTVQFTSVGDATATMGAATLSQIAMYDGFLDWSIVHDGCAGTMLAPGASCSVTARFAPNRPDGSPYGTVYATIDVPDGQSIDATGQVSAKVYPLSGQPVGLSARAAFRKVVLAWGQPQAVPAGWSTFHQIYDVYEYLPDGSLHLITTSVLHTVVVGGLPDNDTRRFVVRDEQSGADAPLSVPATTTTSGQELIYIDETQGRMLARSLAPQAASVDSANLTSAQDLTGAASTGLAVARNQTVLAYAKFGGSDVPRTASYVCTANVDASPGAAFCSGTDTSTQWDTAPSVSPDGARVVFTHGSTPSGPTSLEIASTVTGSTPTVVPNSVGLSDATFNAAGTALVAVQATGDTTQLVTVSPTGTRAVLAGTTGLSEPDVAANGTIVAVRTTPDAGSSDAAPTTSLVLLAAGATTANPIAAAQAGTNVHPRFSPAGTSVYYTHDDTAVAPTPNYGDLFETGDADEVDLGSGTVTTLFHVVNDNHGAGTPFVLTADGTHGPDATAPTLQLVSSSPAVDLATIATASWLGTDANGTNQVASGLRSYDTRYRAATAGHTFGAYVYPATWQGATMPGVTLNVVAGGEYCFSARARDLAGNVSAWTSETCTTSPVDDRTLHTTATQATSASAYLGTYSTGTKTGVKFTLAAVTTRRIGILATTCSTCGSVKVTLGAHTLGTVSTHASATHYRQTIWMPLTATFTGTLTITTLSAAPVRLDGVVVQH